MRRLFFLSLLAVVSVCSCKNNPTTPQPDPNADVSLPVPPPDSGIQLVFGPFDVPLGQEVQIDHWFKLGTTVPFDVGRIEIATNYGTHHMNLFRTLTPHPDSDEYNFASQAIWDESDLMIEAQQHNLDWSLPPGVSVHLNANEQMCMQVHYVNATTQSTPNGHGKVVINLYKAAQPVSEHASMLFAQKVNFALSPHSDTTLVKYCNFGATQLPVKIYGMTGHFHSRGKEFVVEKWDLANNVSLGEIYRNTAWSEPPFKVFDPPVELQPNQTLKYSATYHNDRDTTIYFGPHVESQEHCNLFLWFSPGYKDGQTIYDKTN